MHRESSYGGRSSSELGIGIGLGQEGRRGSTQEADRWSERPIMEKGIDEALEKLQTEAGLEISEGNISEHPEEVDHIQDEGLEEGAEEAKINRKVCSKLFPSDRNFCFRLQLSI